MDASDDPVRDGEEPTRFTATSRRRHDPLPDVVHVNLRDSGQTRSSTTGASTTRSSRRRRFHWKLSSPSFGGSKHTNKNSNNNNNDRQYHNSKNSNSNSKNNTTKVVHWLRWLLVIVLCGAAVTVAVLVYLYTSGKEEEEFQAQLESDADKLLTSVGRNFQMTMSAADDFMHRVLFHARLMSSSSSEWDNRHHHNDYNSTTTTAGTTFQILGTNTNENGDEYQWPFIPPLPGLAVQTSKLLSLTNSIYMAFYPWIANKEERLRWENFTRHHDHWVEDALRVQSTDPNFHGPLLHDYNVSYQIWNNEGPEPSESEGPFLPSWMGSPVIPYYYPFNWNALAYDAFADGLKFCMTTKSVVVTPVANNADPLDPIAVAQARTTSDWALPYLDPQEDPTEPFSDIYYPVMSNLDQVMADTSTASGDNNDKALGAVAFSFYWRHSLKNILPTQSTGLILVVDNPCGPRGFTYQIDGPTPTFLGFGDLHESKFDHHKNDDDHHAYAFTASLANLTNTAGQGRTYTGVPMTHDFCPYSVTIYPSSEMQSKYITNGPIIFCCGSALIFIFVTALFCTYDVLMRREFHTKQKLLEMKRQLMRFVHQEVQTPLAAVCQGLSLLQNDMNEAVPTMTDSYSRGGFYNSHYLLDDCNVHSRSMALEDDADELRSHLEGWIQMTKEICSSAESSADFLTSLLNWDKLQQTGSLHMDWKMIKVWSWIQKSSREFWLNARKRNVRYSLDNQFLPTTTTKHDKKATTSTASDSAAMTADDVGNSSIESKTGQQQQQALSADPEKGIENMKIVGDEMVLTQLLRNLISNAVKFTPEGGTLILRTSWEPITRPEKQTLDKYTLECGKEVTLKREGMARMDVIDSGEGMSEEELAALFQEDIASKFSLDSDNYGPFDEQPQGGGSHTQGLGLFISQKMAAQHNGSLTAYSDGLGCGSTFSLQLPLYFLPDEEVVNNNGQDGSYELSSMGAEANV